MCSKNVISGFPSTGVFLVDAVKFPEDLFNPKELREFKNSRAIVLFSKPDQMPGPESNFVTPTGFASNFLLPVDMEKTLNHEQISHSTTTPNKTISNEAVPTTPNSIIGIFTTEVKKVQQKSAEDNTARKPRKMSRLKAGKYGEVVTTEEVLLQVKENEDENEEKQLRKQGLTMLTNLLGAKHKSFCKTSNENCFLPNLVGR